MGPVSREAAVKKERFPHLFLTAGRPAWMEGELQSLGGEHSNRFVGGKRESNLHRRLALPPCAPQPETLICQCGQGLGTIAQALEVRPRERTRVGCVETA